MTRLTRPELLLANLKGKIQQFDRGYIPKENAYKALREYTGKDFGYNTIFWELYLWKLQVKRKVKKRFFVKKIKDIYIKCPKHAYYSS